MLSDNLTLSLLLSLLPLTLASAQIPPSRSFSNPFREYNVTSSLLVKNLPGATGTYHPMPTSTGGIAGSQHVVFNMAASIHGDFSNTPVNARNGTLEIGSRPLTSCPLPFGQCPAISNETVFEVKEGGLDLVSSINPFLESLCVEEKREAVYRALLTPHSNSRLKFQAANRSMSPETVL